MQTAASKLNRYWKALNRPSGKLAAMLLLKAFLYPNEAIMVHLVRLYGKSNPTSVEMLEQQLLLECIKNKSTKESDLSIFDKYERVKRQIEYNAISIPTEDGYKVSLADSTEQRFRYSLDSREIKGIGLYPVTSYISHSCVPNVNLEFEAGNLVKVVAAVNLKANDELTGCYLLISDEEQRIKLLNDTFGFKCKCQYCSLKL
jgi:hypothetical protein